MAESDERLADEPSGKYPFPGRMPDNFVPEQVIFREMDITNLKDPVYVGVDVPTSYRGNRFDRLIRKMAKGTYRRNSPDDPEDKALDIPVYKNSIVVLKIVEGQGMFADPAIWLETRSRPYPENFYGALTYVDADGRSHERWVENCSMVYFSALFRAGDDLHPHKQSLIYHVDQKRIEIDPDVRHPGNGNGFDEIGGN